MGGTGKRARPNAWWRSRIFLVIVSLLVGWGLCEVILAIAWTNPYRNEEPDHILKLQVHHPNAEGWIDRSQIDPSLRPSRFRTDGRSYILPSFQHEDPDLTVAFLGASTTENIAVEEGSRFHAVVADLLATKGLQVNTLNVARSGNTVHDSLNVLMNHVVLDQPDIAVLMHATNDTGVLRRDPEYRSRMGHVAGLSDAVRWSLQIASRHSSVFGLLRQATTRKSAVRQDAAFRRADDARRGAPPEAYEQRLRAYVRICRALEIEPVLMVQPLASSHTELTPEWADTLSQNQFNSIARRVALEEQAEIGDRVVFLRHEVEGWDEPMRIFFDGMHVTDQGSREIARYIARRLEEIAEVRLEQP